MMKASILIAGHNGGPALLRTVASVVETLGSFDYEIVLADDASTDTSVEAVERTYPQVRILRHETRLGASPAKNAAARIARGEVLVFLDGHCKPEPGALARLIDDVERLADTSSRPAIVTPAIAGLHVGRWRNDPDQIGHGYRLDLTDFACGWLPLCKLKPRRVGRRMYFESPALIGCVLAIRRDDYANLGGFDPHMRLWGSEDLDLGLACWLSGGAILHDTEAVVGHRFRRTFFNYSVPMPQVVANQLRMARRNFTRATWHTWVESARGRHAGQATDHPEGLWAAAWERFQLDRASADGERSRRLAHRQRDEFWYAERFGLNWPTLGTRQKAGGSEAAFAPPLLAMQTEAEAEPSPSPAPCRLTGVTPKDRFICIGEEISLSAQGENLGDVRWSAPGGTPESGTGRSFRTNWDAPGHHIVTAECGSSKATTRVSAVRITFDEPLIVTGFTLPPEPKQIVKETFLICEPADAVTKVVLSQAGQNHADIVLGKADAVTGKLPFGVKGTTATPASSPKGQMRIEAGIGGSACAVAQVVVAVPKRISPDSRIPFAGDVTPRNLLLNRGTSPVADVPLDQFKLVTAWGTHLLLTVNDQFGNSLDELYNGVRVEEIIDGKWLFINQQLVLGSYEDPVGWTQPNPAPTVMANSNAAKNWGTDPRLLMGQKVNFEQNISVRIGGYEIGKIHRLVTATPPNHLNIRWR